MKKSIAITGNSGPKVRSDCEITLELKDEAEKICGKPQKLQFEEDIVAAIKWVDGTVIDVVGKIKSR